MLPVTIGLGLINFNVLINSTLGSLVSDRRAARDRRRLPHLHAAPGDVQRRHRDGALPGPEPLRRPPRLRRPARADSPTACARSSCCSSRRRPRPSRCPSRSRGSSTSTAASAQSSTDLVSSALFWFSFSLPFSGVNLLLTRTFFSLQKPWITDRDRRPEPHRQRRRLGRALQAVRDRGDRHRHRRLERGDDARADVLPAPRAARPPRRAAARSIVVDPDHLRRRAAGRRLLRHLVRARPGARAWACSRSSSRSASRWSVGVVVYALAVACCGIPEARQIEGFVRGRLARRGER